jgi:hypothetical protein
MPPAWDGAVIPVAVVVVAVTLAAVALLVTGRRAGPDVPSAAVEPAEDHVAAALQRRTLRRGRLRLDDAMGDAGETPAAAPARSPRRSG